MKIFKIFMVLLFMVLLFTACSKNENIQQRVDEEIEKTEFSTVQQSNNNFAFDLFKKLNNDSENIVFSSFSVSNALTMASETTNEEISRAIRSGLRLPGEIEEVRRGYQSTLQYYAQDKEEYKLAIANSLWIEKNYNLQAQTQKNIVNYYLGDTYSFDNDLPQESANLVNAWCSDKTAGMIDQILNPGDINPLTHLILANAIYFKGSWEKEFNEDDTEINTFNTFQQEKIKVNFMRQKDSFLYTEDEDVQVLRMAYKGGDLAMLIILPRKNDIRTIQKELSTEQLLLWNKQLKTYDVDVALPKFKFEYSQELNQPLMELGMKRAFIPKSKNELAISSVQHKAIIDVNEVGTEASAVTAVVMTTRSMPQQYEMRKFIADHPFLFLIQDNKTQNILFLGKVEKPEYKDQ